MDSASDPVPQPTSRQTPSLISPLLTSPPWTNRSEWVTAKKTVSYLVDRYTKEIESLKKHAENIRDNFNAIFRDLEELCALSCKWCTAPCCQSARIWWDLRDLIFLTLIDERTAPHQPIVDDILPCSYLGPKGCRLERLRRPWICTWYLCADQKNYLRKTDPVRLDRLQLKITRIQSDRKQLEDDFIELTSPGKAVYRVSGP